MRRVVERALAGKLTREFTSDDYDRLAAAVVRLRAAVAVLRRGGDDAASGAGARDDVRAALAEIEAITGVAPSELGDVFAPNDAAGSGPRP
jgi:hypothetical protein